MYIDLPIFLLFIYSLSCVNSSQIMYETTLINYCPPVVNYCPHVVDYCPHVVTNCPHIVDYCSPELIHNTTVYKFNHNLCESRLYN
jgi:hypothetical protein